MNLKSITPQQAMECTSPDRVFFVITGADKPPVRPNIMTAGWGMLCSYEPPMFAVAVQCTNYSCDMIRQTGEFVVAFLAPRHARCIDLAGTQSGREVDKFAELGLRQAPPTRVRVPLLADSPLQLECTVAWEVPAGDHIVFAGHIVAAHTLEPSEPKVEDFHRVYVPPRPAP